MFILCGLVTEQDIGIAPAQALRRKMKFINIEIQIRGVIFKRPGPPIEPCSHFAVGAGIGPGLFLKTFVRPASLVNRTFVEPPFYLRIIGPPE